jgi:hypothetical protein
MTTIAHDAALLVTAAGLIVATLALARTRQIPLSLAVLLDFFTAAGLLRLVGPPTWARLATVALTIAIRQLASRGLRAAQAGHLSLASFRHQDVTTGGGHRDRVR